MEPKPSSGPSSQGRQKMNYACEACRAAKTKCQSGPQPDICKRCSEFKRECIFRTGPRTRRPKASLRADPEASPLPPPPGPSKTFSIDFEMPAVEEPSDAFDALREQHEHFLENLVLIDGDSDGTDNQQQQQQQQQQNNEDMLNLSGENLPPHKTFSFNDMSTSPSLSSAAAMATTTPPRPKAVMNLGIKPQFNLDSATRLLASFRVMLPHLPCLVLPAEAGVRDLARSSPFVLLAILAVTSCSSSLQGHSLYDEEFRKVLGLKFVAGGERSLELLQGILVYCAWYPFHLRPKNKQSFQYIRMAVDIVQDLEMEEDPDLDLLLMSPERRARKLENLRALLSCYYIISAFSSTWNKVRSTLRYTPQLARCADALEEGGDLEQDRHLAWLVRLQYVSEELIEAQRGFERGPQDHQSEMQRNLIRVGLEAQVRDFKERMPPQYASTTSIFLHLRITEAIILAPPLLRVPRGRPDPKELVETVSAQRLLSAAHVVRAIFDHVASLTPRAFGGLSGADYGRFIVAVIMAYRLSFPMLRVCRDYDVARGRRVLELGEMLRRLIEAPDKDDDDDALETPDPKSSGNNNNNNNNNNISSSSSSTGAAARKPRKSDAVSALRVVLRSVRGKFEEKSAALDAMSAAAAAATFDTTASGGDWAERNIRSFCPMINGSLKQYIPLWAGQRQPEQDAGSYATSQTSSSGMMTDALSSGLGMGVDPGASFVGPMQQMGLDGGSFEDKPLMYHDLWATMTMGWAGDMGEVNMEDIGNTGYGDMLDQY